MRLILAAAFSLSCLAVPAAAAAQDGAALYNAQCKSCHSLTGPSTPAGPSLKGVSGRKLASAAGYSYSPGLTKKGGTWTDEALDAYLTNPTGYAPGTKMFNRVGSPQARTAIITYLKTQK
ncbi:MAG: c-type cytochrome [Caulobacter sp.]|nr:c-type cytochrome [Caulobacter sp.]